MITQEKLKEMLDYNAQTGIFTWIKPANTAQEANDAYVKEKRQIHSTCTI